MIKTKSEMTAEVAEKTRLTSHWKVITGKGDTLPDAGAAIWTISVPSILVCDVGSALQDDGSWKPDIAVGARICKTHNEALMHPDATKVRNGARAFLDSVRKALLLEDVKSSDRCREHIVYAIEEFSKVVNFR